MGNYFMKKQKVSLKHIAESLSVSNTLVSLVLNHKGDEHGISKETQKKVYDKAKEMEYMPSFMARGLRTGRSYTIGLILSDISNPFYSKMVRYMEDEAAKNDYTFLICSSDESPEKEKRIIKMLVDRQVDGLIISSSQSSPEFLTDLEDKKIPYVLIDRFFEEHPQANSVYVDNVRGVYKGVEFLVTKGYKRIAMFAVTPIYISSIRERIDGYLKSLKAFGYDYGNELLVEVDFYNLKQSIQSSLNYLLHESGEPIDAIFAINNNVAVACMQVLREMNLQVPNDIGLLSFDDIDLFQLTNPSISAISQPVETISKTAVNRVINMIRNSNTEIEHITLQTELIARESTQKL
jgi:LacI family transcriptional regulator